MPPPLLVDSLCEILRQLHDFGITREEEVPELMLLKDAEAWIDEFMYQIGEKKEEVPGPSNFHVNMTYVLSAIFCAKPDQPTTMEGDYLATEPVMALVSVEEAGRKESRMAGLPEPTKKKPARIYSDRMVFSNPSVALANYVNPIYVTAHLEGVPFKKVLIDGGAAVNVLPLKQMRKLCRSENDLIPIDFIVSSFFGAITRTYGILPLEVDLGFKQIILAFFVVDNSSTYGALLGRDWIHQNLFVSSTLHQQVVVYHKSRAEEPGFWELVEAESRPFIPTTNVAETNFYNPSIGILQCLGANKNGHPTKVTTQKLIKQGLTLTKEE